jgi:leader peptidase (prepilin peptidase)/N-methyltransferase
LVELFTGVCFAATAAWVGFTVVLPFALWFTAACIAMALIDLEHQRLPNSLTASTLAVVVIGLTVTAAVEGAWADFWRAVAGGVLLALFYALLVLLYPKGMGIGDVKLAPSLGAVMAWHGWASLVVGGFAAFVLGAVVGVAGMVAGRAGRKSAIPFGPFMILGAVVGVVFGAQIADWYANFVI